MTLVENLQTWKEAVESYNEGDFQRSLDKFRDMKDSSAKIAFNIGRTYLSLCDLQAAIQAFQEVIKKDEHLAVGHFMLGVVNLMCTRYSDALVNFNETFRNLRESKFIDYKQLGMRYKLYKCEVLLNRAVCLSSLGYIDSAVEDLLAGLQCKVEPRHSIIDVSLNNLQSGQGIEFLVMDAIFQPPKSKTANLEKRDYLGKLQVVVDSGAYETMETPLHLRGRINSSAPTATSKPPVTDVGESYRVLYDFTAQNANEVSVKAGDIITVTETANDGWFTMVTNDSRKNGLVPGSYVEKYKERDEPVTERQALLTDLRKKETRQSLRKVKPPVNKQQYKPLPGERHSSVIESDHTYANSYREHPRKERPKTVELGRLKKMSPKPVPRLNLFLQKMHAGPPKFRRKNSLENILVEKSPKSSPRFGKKGLGSKKGETNKNDVDDDDGDYEHIPDVTEVKPYAVHDVITPAERLMSTNGRKAPERPTSPPKVVTTMKPSRAFAPPTVAPRFPRAKSISTVGSITSTVEAKPTLGSPTFPKPVKMPPKVPQSPPKGAQSPRRAKKDTETPAKEVSRLTFWTRFDPQDESSVLPNLQNAESLELSGKDGQKPEENEKDKIKIEEVDIVEETEPKRDGVSQDVKNTWFEDTFLNSKHKLKKEIHEKLRSFPWLCGAYGLAGSNKKINHLHIYLTVKRGMKKCDVRRDLEEKFKCNAKEYFELIQEPKGEPKIKFLVRDQNGVEAEAPEFATPVQPTPGGGVLACSIHNRHDHNYMRIPEENETDSPDVQGTGTLTMFCCENGQHYALTCFHVACASDVTRLDFTFNAGWEKDYKTIKEMRRTRSDYQCQAKEKRYYFQERKENKNSEAISFGEDGSNYSKLGDFSSSHFDDECDIMSLKIPNDVKFSCKIAGVTSPDWSEINDELFERVFKGSKEDSVDVQKNGFSSALTRGCIVPYDFSFSKEEDSLFEDGYVVKGHDYPFLDNGDSGSLVLFHDKKNVKQAFAYAVCEVDADWLPKLKESKSSSNEGDSDSSSTWSDESDDGGIVFQKESADDVDSEEKTEKEETAEKKVFPNGSYSVCLPLDTALENLAFLKAACFKDCANSRQ